MRSQTVPVWMAGPNAYVVFPGRDCRVLLTMHTQYRKSVGSPFQSQVAACIGSGGNKYQLLDVVLSSASAPRCTKCAVDRATISVLVIMPVSLPACANMMCRKFYDALPSARGGQRGWERE